MKKYIILCMATLLLCISSSSAWAAPPPILVDDFNNKNLVDMNKTDAVVKVSEGYVQLPQTGSDSIAVEKGTGNVLLINGNQTELYNKDPSGQLVKNPHMTFIGLTDPVALAFSGNGSDYWSLSEEGKASYIAQSPDGAVENPMMVIEGIKNPISITAISPSEVAIQDGSSVKVFVSNGQNMVQVPEASFDSGIDEPLKILSIPGTYDIALVDRNGSRYYYNYRSGGHVLNPGLSITGTSQLIAADQKDMDLATLTVANYLYWTHFNGESSSPNQYLTTGPYSNPVAMAISPDEEYYMVRAGDKAIRMDFNGSGYVVNENGSISGLTQGTKKYLHPRSVESKTIMTSENITGLSVSTDEDLPAGTTITIFLSVDGGGSWKEAINGKAIFSTPGKQVRYRATLNTANASLTPLLKRIEINNYSMSLEDFLIIDIVNSPAGNPPLPTDLQVKAKAGYNFTFQVHTRGIKDVAATLSDGGKVDLIPSSDPSEYENIWKGVYATDPFLPSGTLLTITFNANGHNEGQSLNMIRPDQVLIDGSILDDIVINQIE